MNGPDFTRFQQAHRRKQGLTELEKSAGFGTGTVQCPVRLHEPAGTVAFDVFSGRELPLRNGVFQLELERWGGKLIAFLPESPAPFAVELPDSARSGFPVELTVSTSGKTAVPFTVSAVSPDGRTSAEYRARLLSGKSGRSVYRFAFAVNDLRGTWRFRVRNEFTGTEKSAEIALR